MPEGFTVHPKLVRPLDQRRDALGADGGITWAHAEQLAFASLLQEGTPIRLTGQDAERGTFSQRHLVLHDPKTGQEYCPIQNLPEALAPMELHNSPLVARWPRSASSTATRRRGRRRSCCGRASSATSPTAPR